MTVSQQNQEKEVSKLRIVSLGGVDEVGKNMTVFEYEDDIIVVDCGSIFPKGRISADICSLTVMRTISARHRIS